jgi:hypothetical protein
VKKWVEEVVEIEIPGEIGEALADGVCPKNPHGAYGACRCGARVRGGWCVRCVRCVRCVEGAEECNHTCNYF